MKTTMKILITGGSGFLGIRLVERLISKGHDVTVFSRHEAPEIKKAGAKQIIGNVSDHDALSGALSRVDIVYHLAANLDESNPSMEKENKENTENMIDCCREKKIKSQMVVFEPRKPRYNGAWGVYDPPRNVLKSIPGLQLVEMERIREYTWCCGSGGGVKEAYPEFSNWTATERIEEARASGAEAIVSACGWCERNFLDAMDAGVDKMPVYDIAEMVQKAL